MRKILILLGLILFAGFDMAYACDTNQIDVLGDGTQCLNGKFAIKTTNLNADDEFKFTMTAQGTFTVDCGEDGTLTSSADDITNGNTITRNNVTQATYTCTYTTGGVKNIAFDGTATNYSTAYQDSDNNYYAAIAFSGINADVATEPLTPTKIASVSGNLSAIFPYISGNATNGAQPRFYRTFSGATNLTTVPDTLFADYTKGAIQMFYSTFAYCTGLQSIPAGLFNGIKIGGSYLFGYTFNGCTGLTSIPAWLFSSITTGALGMFRSTFSGCTRLTSIPSDLFSSITTGATGVFRYTFSGCTGLTTIPAGLFSGITTGADNMFYATFYGCTGLTSIPAGLFSSIKTGAENMFRSTFYGCTNLSGYIPPSTFAGLIANGHPTATDIWDGAFYKTKLATSCPAGTVQFITGYESRWGGHVSCVDENLVCGMGEYLPAHWYQCEQCPENNYCVGGTYPYSETITSGITQCASGLYSPNGMWESAQCGRILHVGDGFVYLRATKKTSPALHLDLDHDGVADYFGNMTTLDVPMSRDTQRKLKVRYNNTTYSIYDDSVEIPTE